MACPEQWRIPIGEAEILDFFQTLLPKATDPTLALNALKIVGNACADKGELLLAVCHSTKTDSPPQMRIGSA